jgi:flagellar assembly protein FliH
VASEGDRRRAAPAEAPAVGHRAGDRPGEPPPRSPHTRFIPREELSSFSAWKPSSFGGPARESHVKATPDPAQVKRQAELDLQRQAELAARQAEAEIAARAAELRGARDGGYQDGYRDGLAALEAFKTQYSAQSGAQVASIVETLQAQLGQIEQHLAQRVAGIALEVARQVVRSELQVQPEHVVAVAQEALGVLLVSARHVTVRLNPADHELVAIGLHDGLKARGARLVADAQISRGGCLVESDIGTVDARVQTRWERASAALGRRCGYEQDASQAGDAYNEDMPEQAHSVSEPPTDAQRDERRAAPSRPAVPSGDRPTYASDEGPKSDERRAAPSRPAVPSGDRPTYASDEGQT